METGILTAQGVGESHRTLALVRRLNRCIGGSNICSSAVQGVSFRRASRLLTFMSVRTCVFLNTRVRFTATASVIPRSICWRAVGEGGTCDGAGSKLAAPV